METLVLERTTPIDALFSFVGADRIRLSRDDGGKLNVAPVTDTGGGDAIWQSDDDVLNLLNRVYAETDSNLDETFEYAQLSTLKDDW